MSTSIPEAVDLSKYIELRSPYSWSAVASGIRRRRAAGK